MLPESSHLSAAIVIVGPTASGKTSLSLSAARHFNTSIISADSRQCYQEMTIGTAKPSPEELASCPHYFIDSHSIHEMVDTVVFEQEALLAAERTFRNHDIVIVSGGTGMYVKVFCEGIDDIPPVDPSVRETVDKAWKEGGIDYLQKWLNEVDPLFLSGMKEKGNRARMTRALEVKLSSGRSILDFREGNKKQRPFFIRKIGISWSRDDLYRRINQRVDVMMKAGLLSEAESLYPHRHLKALQTVGYKELFDYFDNKISLDEAVDKIKQHTRNFAKRQLTWFRKDPEITWASYDEWMESIRT
jgi:tRNA dimethylallyltransferase